jgi:hypothetical protein
VLIYEMRALAVLSDICIHKTEKEGKRAMRLEKESCRRRYIHIYTRHILYSSMSSMVLTVLMRGVLSVVMMWQSNILPCNQPDQARPGSKACS